MIPAKPSQTLSGFATACRALATAATLLTLQAATARAAFITIDQAGMNTIFSQSSFDGTPIDIEFLPPETIVAPELLVIGGLSDLNALVDLAPYPSPIVDAFFVDTINYCGFDEAAVSGAYYGCAQLPGHVLVEESDAAQMDPATLMGHELGHNLNLQHVPLDPSNLMSYFFPHGMDLTDEQVATILESPLVHTDAAGDRFIQIEPILIAAPEPSALALLGAGLIALVVCGAVNRARKQAADVPSKRGSPDRDPRPPYASLPPSTPMIWPVMNEAFSELTNTMAWAISSGVPARLSGMPAIRPALRSAVPVSRPSMSVSTGPGATALTRTPEPAASSATDFVSPSTACLLAT